MSDIEYLKGLDAVRERAHLVLGAAEKNQLLHFDYDASKMGDVADYVAGVISRDFGPDKYDQIPPHGRWQHFDVGGVSRVSSLIQRWESQGWDQLEVTRRLIDLFFVAVLLDAGAGDVWKFQEPGSAGQAYGRSEGIAVAALYMFKAGAFASKVGGDVEVELVDGQALVALDVDTFKRHFQITEENPLVGAASRVELLQRVGSSLMKLPDYFGSQGRPGQLVDYLVRQAGPSKSLDFTMLWKILQETLLPAWPSNRTRIADIPIGDAWPLQVLSNLNGSKDTSTHNNQTHHIAPFHKLTQWLPYSLTVPFMRVLDMQWKNLEKGTGLPEYRNGGLFVDLGVLKLKPQALDTGLASSRGNLPSFEATSDVIVEWRAMTVALLDKLHELISARFADQGVTLSMPQMLEAGSWKSGRELAAQYRPESKSSPILIDGDGTLF